MANLSAKDYALGCQHLLAMFGATVLLPLITGFSPAAALFSAGVGTHLFHLCTKGKVLVFLGSSFAFIGAVCAADCVLPHENSIVAVSENPEHDYKDSSSQGPILECVMETYSAVTVSGRRLPMRAALLLRILTQLTKLPENGEQTYFCKASIFPEHNYSVFIYPRRGPPALSEQI